jgi:hypothetical protein
VQSLATWGSSKNSPFGATPVFLQALKATCTPAQWARYPPLARRAATPAVWSGAMAEVPSLGMLPAMAA